MPRAVVSLLSPCHEEIIADEISPSGIELRRSDFAWYFVRIRAANGAGSGRATKAG
jgi:hypothetical protein